MENDLELAAFEPFIYFTTSMPSNSKLAPFYCFLLYFAIPIGQYVRILIELINRKYKVRKELLINIS